MGNYTCICLYDQLSFKNNQYKNEKWAAQGQPMGWQLKQLTETAYYLCKLIIISAHGLHMGWTCPLTFNLIIIQYYLIMGCPRVNVAQTVIFHILTQHVCNASSDWTVGKNSGSKMTIYVPQLLRQNAIDSLAQLSR